jgi:hypothetical protein
MLVMEAVSPVTLLLAVSGMAERLVEDQVVMLVVGFELDVLRH